MRRTLPVLYGVCSFILAACSGVPTSTPFPTLTPTIIATPVPEAPRYNIDRQVSTLKYVVVGNGVFSMVQFPGAFQLKEGTLIFAPEGEGYRIRATLTIDGQSVTGPNSLILDALRNSLEVDKYPLAYFGGDSKEIVKRDAAQTVVKFTLAGTLQIRDRKRSVELPMTLTLQNGEVRASGQVIIDLLDYEIHVPTALINSRMNFTVDVTAKEP